MPESYTKLREVHGFRRMHESGQMRSSKKKTVKCKVCNREPHEIEEYVAYAEENNMTPEQYVVTEEGTYNKRSKKFYCTTCYIKAGMPVGTA